MRPVSLPEIRYGATAVRPDWTDLPIAVRAAITDRLTAPLGGAKAAGGGFTSAYAGVLETESGSRVFVKAAPFGDMAFAYAREALITSLLPRDVRAARPLWTLEESGYFVSCLEAVAGRVPDLPWPERDLEAALTTWREAAAALSRPSAALLAAGLPRLPGVVRDELSWWSEIAAGRAPAPPAPPWALSHLDELAALEQRLPSLVEGDGMLHGDLRIDNVLIDDAGAAWLCDWTWPCLGAPWFDTVTLLVSAWAAGADADRLLDPWHPPAGGVDGVLAAMSGYWLVRAAGDPGTASPHARQHHRFSGTQALTWLATRRKWPMA